MSSTPNLCLMDCPIYYSESLVMLGLEDMKEHLSVVPPASTYLTHLILLSPQKMIYQHIRLPLHRCKTEQLILDCISDHKQHGKTG